MYCHNKNFKSVYKKKKIGCLDFLPISWFEFTCTQKDNEKKKKKKKPCLILGEIKK